MSAGRDHDVIVWDVATGKEAYRIDEAQSASVEDARFSPDGRWLVTAGPKTARLWTADGEGAATCTARSRHSSRRSGFDARSRAVVTREPDGTVRRWACELCGDLASLEKLAESRLRPTRRTITADERASYFR